MRVIFVAVFLSMLSLSKSSRLVRESMYTFRQILQKGFGHGDNLTVAGVVQLMHLMDGHPKYNLAAIQYIAEKLGSWEVSWEYLMKVVDAIYGDAISDDPFQPQEIHLAYTNNPLMMKVSWATMQGLDKPVVEYMPIVVRDWKHAQVRNAANYTYTVPKNWWPIFTGMLYDVDMENLTPGSYYKYRVGGWDSVNATMRYSEEFIFQAAPVSNDPSRKTKIFTLADHGTFMLFGFETVNRMAALMKELQPDFVFVAGDLSYAGLSSDFKPLNISKEDEFEHIWDLLAIQNQPVAAKIPWMVGDGNHERFYNWTAFTSRYKMPHNREFGSDGNFWYTFTYGNVQWVSASSEHDLSEGSAQMNFLRAALTAAQSNRATVPWIVLSIHKPLYCSVEGSPSFRDALEGLVLEFDIDLTITGHMHAYERIHPVKNGAVTVYPTKKNMHKSLIDRGEDCKLCRIGEVDVYEMPKGTGPVHLMQGHAGGMQAERWVQPPPAWSAFRMANGIIPPNRTDDTTVQWLEAHGMSVELDFSDSTTIDAEKLRDLPLFPNLADPSLSYDYKYNRTYGFGYITAINATHLHYQAIPDSDGLLNHDEFWIIKER